MWRQYDDITCVMGCPELINLLVCTPKKESQLKMAVLWSVTNLQDCAFECPLGQISCQGALTILTILTIIVLGIGTIINPH